MNVLNFIKQYLRKTKLMASIIIVCVVIHMIIVRSNAYFMAQAIGLLPEYSSNNQVINQIIFYLLLYFFIIIIDRLLDLTQRYTSGKFIPYFNSLVYKDLFALVHHHSIRFFQEEMAGKVSAKVKNIVSGINQIFRFIIFGLIMPVLGLIVSLSIIFFANIKLGFLLLFLNMLAMIAVLLIRRKIGSFSARRANFNAVCDGVFIDAVSNSNLIKSFANYFYEKHYFYSFLKTAVRSEQKEMTKNAWLEYFGQSVFDLMQITSLCFVFIFWYQQNINLADVILCLTLIERLMRDVANLGFFVGEFFQRYGEVQDGLTLIYKPCKVVDLPNASNINMKNKSFKLEHLYFGYSKENKLFKDFNLTIKSGEKIGLVGDSGAGKSTLINLLIRYFDVDSGRILLGGEDISQVRQESLRSKIAIIPQDTSLFNRSIMENIRYGNTKATDEEVILAAKKAYADEFIEQLPQGYNSKVGERGVMLSGGERQRIAIARAILKNAPVLILDEATSALDSVSEKYIQKSLKQLMKGKTVIAIAHRLSTLQEMTRLIVLKKGQIVEDGTHEDLLAKHGAYYKYYKIQNFNK